MINTATEFILEIVTAVCGFILPRMILAHFGSAYNGITQSVSQFISCVALLKSGIGSVTRAALYKPLAEHDSYTLSEITNATSQYMQRIALIFSGGILVFAAVYPFLTREYMSWLSTFLLVIILSIHTFAQYFFGLTYQQVIQADQRNYFISIVQIISVIANTLIAAMLINMDASIHIVKLGSALVFAIPPVIYMVYARKKYKIDKKVPPNKSLIAQRWDAFAHQIANFINTNTDMILISMINGVLEVSVYSVYIMIVRHLRTAITAVMTGTQAAFGNMIAKKEYETLKNRFSQLELLMFFISTIAFTTAWILLIPFIRLYTKGITDVEYCRPVFALLICLASYFSSAKLPYDLLVFANGSFKETKVGAFVEATLNILISVILGHLIGMNGIIIGTVFSGLFRTMQYNIFVHKSIIADKKWFSIFKIFIYTYVCGTVCYFLSGLFLPEKMSGYGEWAIYAVAVFAVVVFVSVCALVAFFPKRCKLMLKDIDKRFRLKKKGSAK